MKPMNIVCADCGGKRVARTVDELLAGCATCAAAEAEGRPCFPGSAMPASERSALDALLSGNFETPSDEDFRAVWGDIL